MNLDLYSKEQLWQIIVETAHANAMYPTHKAYTRDVILRAKPDIAAQELSEKLNMPMGEAMVILNELRPDSKPTV
jgi:hypothetical protein